jgi:phosphoribosyl-AMP cyclohydrolase
VSSSSLDPALAARLKRDAAGLVPAVAQQHDTGEVLMMGWMDDEALHRTLTTGRGTYFDADVLLAATADEARGAGRG